MRTTVRTILAIAAASCALVVSNEAGAQTRQEKYQFDIERRPLTAVLTQFGIQTGFYVHMIDHTAQQGDVLVGPLTGLYTAEEAIEQITRQGGVSFKRVNDTFVIIESSAPKLQGTEFESSTKAEATAPAAARRSRRPAVTALGGQAVDRPPIEEVIVTAQKRSENIQEVPISIAVLNDEVLDRRGVNNLQDLSRAVPGLSVQETGFERRVSIRGIGNVFGSSSTIGTYVDEAAAIGPRGDHQLDFQTYDLSRVEVLRGPQGTLYGQGSMGGTIRYITATPDLERVTGTTDVSATFTADGSPSERIRGMLNMPLVTDTLGIRIAGVYEDTGGWVDQPALSKDDINDRELVNVRTKVLWTPTEALSATAMAIIHRDDRGALGIGADEHGNYQQPLLSPATPSGFVDYELYNATVAYDLSSVQLLSTTTYLDYDSGMRNYGQQCCTPTPDLDGQYTVDRWVFTGTTKTQELRLISLGTSALKWTVGGIYQENESLDNYGAPANNLFGVPGGTLDVDLFNWTVYAEESFKAWAAFGEATYAVSDRLNIGAGLRYFEDDRRLRSEPGGAIDAGTFHSTNPRVFVDYRVLDDVNLYASAAKGFRSGGFSVAGQPPYRPEELWSYELGTKASLMDRRLYLELALTYGDYGEYQIIGQVPGGFENITSNAGDARIRGVDGLLSWRLDDAWELGVTASYVDAEFTRINATSSSHIVGDPVDMVPEYGASVWVDYRFDWTASSGNPGFARVDFNQQGISHFRNRSFAENYHSTSDELSLLNVRLGWSNGRWNAEVYAQNILNENGFDANGSIEKAATRVWPRSYGIRVGVGFE